MKIQTINNTIKKVKITPDLDEKNILNLLPSKSKKVFLFDALEKDKVEFANKSIGLVKKANVIAMGAFISMCMASTTSNDIAQATLFSSPFFYVACTKFAFVAKKLLKSWENKYFR